MAPVGQAGGRDHADIAQAEAGDLHEEWSESSKTPVPGHLLNRDRGAGAALAQVAETAIQELGSPGAVAAPPRHGLLECGGKLAHAGEHVRRSPEPCLDVRLREGMLRIAVEDHRPVERSVFQYGRGVVGDGDIRCSHQRRQILAGGEEPHMRRVGDPGQPAAPVEPPGTGSGPVVVVTGDEDIHVPPGFEKPEHLLSARVHQGGRGPVRHEQNSLARGIEPERRDSLPGRAREGK